MSVKLTAEEIRERMRGVGEWKRRGAALCRTFEFSDFVEAMRWVNRVARRAEREQHHPDIEICWNRVTLRWTTHDAGGLTAKDFDLATWCDRSIGAKE